MADYIPVAPPTDPNFEIRSHSPEATQNTQQSKGDLKNAKPVTPLNRDPTYNHDKPLPRLRSARSQGEPSSASSKSSSQSRISALVPDPPSPFSAAVLRAKRRHEKPRQEFSNLRERRVQSDRPNHKAIEVTPNIPVPNLRTILPLPSQRIPSPIEASEAQPREDSLSPIDRWADFQESCDLDPPLKSIRAPPQGVSVISSDHNLTTHRTVATLMLCTGEDCQPALVTLDAYEPKSPACRPVPMHAHTDDATVPNMKRASESNESEDVSRNEGHDPLEPVVVQPAKGSSQSVAHSSPSSNIKEFPKQYNEPSHSLDQNIQPKPSLALDPTVPGPSGVTHCSTPADIGSSTNFQKKKRKRNRKRNTPKIHDQRDSPTDIKWPVPVNPKLKHYYSPEAARRVKDGKYHMTSKEREVYEARDRTKEAKVTSLSQKDFSTALRLFSQIINSYVPLAPCSPIAGRTSDFVFPAALPRSLDSPGLQGVRH
jgi:hypothetical protein